jgi:hypothetical protein
MGVVDLLSIVSTGTGTGYRYHTTARCVVLRISHELLSELTSFSFFRPSAYGVRAKLARAFRDSSTGRMGPRVWIQTNEKYNQRRYRYVLITERCVCGWLHYFEMLPVS